MPELKRILIVCPASLKYNWAKELSKWLVRPYDVYVCEPKKIRDAGIIIINYDILERIQKLDKNYDLIIADESQKLKSPTTKRFKNFETLNAKYHIALSGTPIMNRPIEIQSTLAWLDPIMWGDRFRFAMRYCDLKRGRFGFDWNGASNLPELQQKLRGNLMVRRLKKDVLKELPPKIRQVIELPHDGCNGVIDEEWATFKPIEAVLEKLKLAVYNARMSEHESDYHDAVSRLREGEAVAFQQMAEMRKRVALAKAPFMVQHLEDCLDHKVVLFLYHHCVIEKVIDGLKLPDFCMVTGKTAVKMRQVEVDKFQGDDDIKLFIGNIQAAGVGLTLTKSSHVVFGELDWTPANLTQAEDRCHRFGQHDSVLVQHLVLEGSLDSYMANKIVKKQLMIEEALNAKRDIEMQFIDGIPDDSAVAEVSRKEVVESHAYELKDMATIMRCLRFIAMRCNWAKNYDGVGFSKFDAQIGHSLAERRTLTNRQAHVGLKIAWKYRKQLEADEVRELTRIKGG